MRCIVTAGPTYENLDEVRRLTNFSTGRLGCELADHLVARGHDVTLLLGSYATWRGEITAQQVQTFTMTDDLRQRLQSLAFDGPGAVFHAAAVSDFKFGKVWLKNESGEMSEIQSGKITTREGTLLAELTPTPKIIRHLRDWYPRAFLAGWKYEVEGSRADVIARARRQLAECHTDACIANGRAYGEGFGLVIPGSDAVAHFQDRTALFEALEHFVRNLLP